MARTNWWMSTLTSLIRSSPFIIAGTTLDEIDVTYYLEHRSSSDEGFSAEAPSILIEPFPDKLTERLCDQHGFVLFEGDTLAFFQALESDFQPLPSAYENRKPDYSAPPGVLEKSWMQFEETFQKVPPVVEPPGGRDQARFLLGAELNWSMVNAGIDVRRDCTVDIDRAIDYHFNDGVGVFIIFDEPGSGKTSLLRRLAHRIHDGAVLGGVWPLSSLAA